MAKVETKFRGSWLDRTTEDAPLPVLAKYTGYDRWANSAIQCKECGGGWTWRMALTGRRAMRKTRARGAVVVYEVVCQKGHTAWYVEGWKYGLNQRAHFDFFGRVEAANEMVKRELYRRDEREAYQEEQGRQWRLNAEQRRIEAEAEREKARKERELRMVEPAFMKEFDEVG